MSKKYRIRKLDLPVYGYIVCSVDYSRPDEYLQEVERDLAKREYSGAVLFDLMLCNGLGSNRFVSMPFDGNDFDGRGVTTLPTVDNKVMKRQMEFYRNHPALLSQSVLTRAQQYQIKSGTKRAAV